MHPFPAWIFGESRWDFKIPFHPHPSSGIMKSQRLSYIADTQRFVKPMPAAVAIQPVLGCNSAFVRNQFSLNCVAVQPLLHPKTGRTTGCLSAIVPAVPLAVSRRSLHCVVVPIVRSFRGATPRLPPFWNANFFCLDYRKTALHEYTVFVLNAL